MYARIPRNVLERCDDDADRRTTRDELGSAAALIAFESENRFWGLCDDDEELIWGGGLIDSCFDCNFCE